MFGQSPEDSPATTDSAGSRRRRRSRRRVLLITGVTVLVVALAIGGWWWSRSRTASAATVTTITYTVQPATLQQSVTTTGTFAPAVQDNLSFPASGEVTGVRVAVGQKVGKGQVLATQDTTALSAAVTSAQATLDAAQTELSSLQSSSSTTATQLSAAQAAVASDQAKLSQAQQNLAGATMTSPIGGIVAQVNLTAGTTVSGGTSTNGSGGAGGSSQLGGSSSGSGSSSSSTEVVVVDTSSWIVNATVEAADLPSLKAGLQATMNLSAATTTSGGSGVSRFGGFGGFGGGLGGLGGLGTTTRSSGASSAGSSQGTTTSGGAAQSAQLVFGTVQSVSQIASSSSGTAAFPLTITVTGKPSGVYIGSTASVSILVRQVTNAIAVPTLAITDVSGQPTVRVQVNGTTVDRPVTLGEVFGQQTQITKGLSTGDVVVIGTRTLAPGAAGFGSRAAGGGAGTRASAGSSAGGR